MIQHELIPSGRTTSVYQDAVRLLLLINAASGPIPGNDRDVPDGSVAVLRSQVLLQKLDFWLRNPDYLADELLTRYEDEGNGEYLALARNILASEEPEVRSYKMLRYLFGAYEPLDEALSVLRTPGLIISRKVGKPGQVQQHDYYLTKQGREVAEKIVKEVPELLYYVDRSTFVVELADGRRGSKLRDIQYLQREYADAAVGAQIVGIASRARERLNAILSKKELMDNGKRIN